MPSHHRRRNIGSQSRRRPPALTAAGSNSMLTCMGAAARAAAVANGAATMATRGASIARHLQRVTPTSLAQFIRRIELATGCVRDVAQGRYRLPWKTVGALTGALAYFLSPIDLIPD